MIVHVANPIYDSVFKFMMEDERVWQRPFFQHF